MQHYQNEDPGAKYNAGWEIAKAISDIIKRCEYFARKLMLPEWHDELKILQRRLYSKIDKNKDAKEDVKEINKMSPEIGRYINKMSMGKNVKHKQAMEVYNYLSHYEEVLRKWVDKFGYGMPDKEDAGSAAWR